MQSENPGATPSEGSLGPPTAPEVAPLEPRAREPVRAALAIILVLIFMGEVIFGLWYGFLGKEPFHERIHTIKEIATIFLSPTVALVGAATGFYFGRSS